MGKIIAIANQKDGNGKTTSALYIAYSLVELSHKVLLVDFDPLSTLTRQVADTKNVVSEVESSCCKFDYSSDHSSETFQKCIINVDVNLDLYPANVNLIQFEVSNLNAENREMVLSTMLSQVKDNYDYILIDTPSSLGLLTTNALAASDFVIVPLRCDYFAGEHLAELLRIIGDISSSLNPGLELLGFIITHVNTQLRSAKKNIQDIRTCFGELVLSRVVEEIANQTTDNDQKMNMGLYFNYMRVVLELNAKI